MQIIGPGLMATPTFFLLYSPVSMERYSSWICLNRCQLDAEAQSRCHDRRGPDAVSVATTAPAQHLLTTEITNAVGSSSAKLFRTHNYRKPRPLGLRFRLVLTEEHTERLEWQM